MAKKTGYWQRLTDVLLGRSAPAVEGVPDVELAELRAKAASLEMDLQERDARMEQMQKEYEALQAAKARAATEAGQEELEKLLKQLSPTLSNLMTLVHLSGAGQEVQVADMAQLARDVEKQLAHRGLEPIGAPTEQTTFDEALHQRMSGGAVRRGMPVTIRLPGYRLGQKVLLKAMVSAKTEEQNG